LFLQIGTSWWVTYRLVYSLGDGDVHGVLHYRWVDYRPGFGFGAVVVEYPVGRTGFRWHVNPRWEYGWIRGQPDGWQGRIFTMGQYRWRRGAWMMEGRGRYEWFWDLDGHQGHHQRFRPALFFDYRIREGWRVQGMIEPMYWVRHRRYAAWSINQWRFFGWVVLGKGLLWRVGPAVFYQLQPRQPVAVLTIEAQMRVKKPIAKSTSPTGQTPHSLDPQP
jgi:hypothetical protein